MKEPDNKHPKLTKNDQEVLKNMINEAKIPDTDIAKKLGLSPQAVFKIRHKLESLGIITGYQPIIDLKKLDIRAMVLLVVKLTPKVWENTTDLQISERIRKIPYIISAFRILEANSSHVLLMGFKDIEQMDKYIAKMQTSFSQEIEIKQIYPFSTDKIIINSPNGLLYEILEKKEFTMKELFLKKNDI